MYLACLALRYRLRAMLPAVALKPAWLAESCPQGTPLRLPLSSSVGVSTALRVVPIAALQCPLLELLLHDFGAAVVHGVAEEAGCDVALLHLNDHHRHCSMPATEQTGVVGRVREE